MDTTLEGLGAVLCGGVIVKDSSALARPEGAVAGVLPLKRGLAGEQSLHHRSGDIVTTIDAARVTARHEEERGCVGYYDVTHVLRTAGAVGIGSFFHRKAEFLELWDGSRETRRLVFALASLCESHCCSALFSEVRHMVVGEMIPRSPRERERVGPESDRSHDRVRCAEGSNLGIAEIGSSAGV